MSLHADTEDIINRVETHISHKKKFKDIQSAENVLLTTPGMHRGIFLKFLDHRTTVNADHYCTSCVT
jgi:hypothetical protein